MEVLVCVSILYVTLHGDLSVNYAGIVQVKYTAVNGSISPIQKDKLALASAGQDYFSTPGTVQMGDKEKSAVIRVNIREVLEVVRLGERHSMQYTI